MKRSADRDGHDLRVKLRLAPAKSDEVNSELFDVGSERPDQGEGLRTTEVFGAGVEQRGQVELVAGELELSTLAVAFQHHIELLLHGSDWRIGAQGIPDHSVVARLPLRYELLRRVADAAFTNL